jgi:hypothetical protein
MHLVQLRPDDCLNSLQIVFILSCVDVNTNEKCVTKKTILYRTVAHKKHTTVDSCVSKLNPVYKPPCHLGIFLASLRCNRWFKPIIDRYAYEIASRSRRNIFPLISNRVYVFSKWEFALILDLVITNKYGRNWRKLELLERKLLTLNGDCCYTSKGKQGIEMTGNTSNPLSVDWKPKPWLASVDSMNCKEFWVFKIPSKIKYKESLIHRTNFLQVSVKNVYEIMNKWVVSY